MWTSLSALAFGRAENANEVVAEAQLVLVADVQVLRPAVLLQVVLVNAFTLGVMKRSFRYYLSWVLFNLHVTLGSDFNRFDHGLWCLDPRLSL